LKYENLVISPHIDDAFFSMGGILINNINKGQKIIDIFTISDHHLNTQADKSREAITRVRMNEELENSRRYNIDVEFLGFKEALLRGYAQITDILDSKRENPMILKIKNKILEEIDDTQNIYFPMAIGRNVDHVIISEIGKALVKANTEQRIYFYEDMPYTASRCYTEHKREHISNTKSPLIPTCATIAALSKIRSCRTYKSQLALRELIVPRIMAYALFLGRGVRFCERTWSFK